MAHGAGRAPEWRPSGARPLPERNDHTQVRSASCMGGQLRPHARVIFASLRQRPSARCLSRGSRCSDVRLRAIAPTSGGGLSHCLSSRTTVGGAPLVRREEGLRFDRVAGCSNAPALFCLCFVAVESVSVGGSKRGQVGQRPHGRIAQRDRRDALTLGRMWRRRSVSGLEQRFLRARMLRAWWGERHSAHRPMARISRGARLSVCYNDGPPGLRSSLRQNRFYSAAVTAERMTVRVGS